MDWKLRIHIFLADFPDKLFLKLGAADVRPDVVFTLWDRVRYRILTGQRLNVYRR